MATKKSTVETYGLETIIPEAKKQNQFTIELKSFGRGGTEDLGGFPKEYHAKKLIQNWYPWVWQHWHDWPELQLWAWCRYEELGATGCSASGKSYIFSFLAWLEYIAASLSTAVVLSSTTKPALKARIWHHIKKFRQGVVFDGRVGTFPCHLIDSQTMIQAQKGDDMHCISGVAVQAGELEKTIGNIQGRHPTRMIVFTDEGEQTPEAIFSARFNLRSGSSFYRFVTAANAINPASAYGQFIAPKAGWHSVKTQDQYWDTTTGVCLHFRGHDSPNVKAGKVVVPGLIKQEDIDAIRQAKGEDSLEYWAYVEGFPPMSGVRNTVLSWSHIYAGKATDDVTWQADFRWVAALDPAFTSGGDDCILRFAKIGKRMDGKLTLWLEKPITIKLQASTSIPEDYQIAEEVRNRCSERNVKPSDFAMDSTAATGLASIIEQRWNIGIDRVNFGSSPTDKRMPGDDKTAKERCRNRVGELWFTFAALVRAGVVRGLDAQAGEEFCIRQYRLEGEKMVLESKSDMKDRTGGKSPDTADATSLLGWLFQKAHGADGGQVDQLEKRRAAWEKAAEKHALEAEYAY